MMSLIRTKLSGLRDCAWPVGVFVVSRMGLLLLVYLSLIYLPFNSNVPGTWRAFPNNLWLDGWARWDAGWYRIIAEQGYSDQPVLGEQRDVVFFPLYPLSIRALNVVTRNSFLSGILISNAAFGLALVLLFRLARELHGETVGRGAVLLLATYPWSFYFSAVYTESLFLLTAVAAFYFGERRRWALAAMCAACASATRVVGITVALGLCVLYLSQIGWAVRRVRRDALWLLLNPAGLAGYMLYLGWRFGDPMIFATSQNVEGWRQGVDLALAWRTIETSLSARAVLAGNYLAQPLTALLVIVVSVVLIAAAWRALGPAYTMWALLCLAVSLTIWTGAGRFSAVVFPLFIAAAWLLKREIWIGAVAYLNTLLLALFAIMYSHWYWIP
jgi:hypothetical protein